MKRMFMCLSLMAGLISAYAQKATPTYEFIDENGTVIKDGETLTRDNVVYDEDIESNIIYSGLKIRAKETAPVNPANNIPTADLEVYFKVNQLDNGMYQACFPGQCLTYGNEYVGKVVEKGEGSVKLTDDPIDLQAEWFPADKGTCSVTYTTKVVNYDANDNRTVLGDGPSFTINFVWGNTSGISSTGEMTDVRSSEYFDLSGRKVSNPQHGLYVKRTTMSDGTVKTVKQVVK